MGEESQGCQNVESNILRCSLDRNKENVTKSPFKSIMTIGTLSAVASISATQTYFSSYLNILNLGRSVRGQIIGPLNSEPFVSLKITSDLD